MAWVRTYDIDTPDGSIDDPAEAADRMNEIKLATQERENVDHNWPLTGSEVSDADAGEHRKITLRTLTAVAIAALTATKAYLYRLVTDGELYFKDDDDNTIQLTSGGKILSASLDMKDEDDMASDSATHTLSQQSSKAYADAVGAAVAAAAAAALVASVPTGGTSSRVDSDGNNMLKTHAYLAQTAGFVNAYITGAAGFIDIYVGATDNPAGVGDMIDRGEHTTAGDKSNVDLFVANGKYFEIRSDGAPIIWWTPFISGGAAPVDQD